jgi:hypothetical protein
MPSSLRPWYRPLITQSVTLKCLLGDTTYHSFLTFNLSFVQVVDFATSASTAALPLVCKSVTASATQNALNKLSATRRAYSPRSVEPPAILKKMRYSNLFDRHTTSCWRSVVGLIQCRPWVSAPACTQGCRDAQPVECRQDVQRWTADR